jgi:hypothetical protein
VATIWATLSIDVWAILQPGADSMTRLFLGERIEENAALESGRTAQKFGVVTATIDSCEYFRFHTFSFVDDPQQGRDDVVPLVQSLDATGIVGSESDQPPATGSS